MRIPGLKQIALLSMLVGCCVSEPDLSQTRFRCDTPEATCPDEHRCVLGSCVPDGDNSYSVACGEAEPALELVPNQITAEPTLHSNQRVLLAASMEDSLLVQSDRVTTDASFGPFGAATLIPSHLGDTTFIEHEGDTIAFASESFPRYIVYCADPASLEACAPLEMFDEFGVLINDDIDGPAVARDSEGLLLTFNRSQANTGHLARPRDATLLQWDSKRIDFGLTLDDPTISKSGALLLAPAGPEGERELYAMRFDGEADNYTERVLVAGPTIGFASFEIGVVDGQAFELFAAGDTRGIREPHRFECTTYLSLE